MKVLITGASSGIGKELAFALAGQGHSLILCGRKKEALQLTGDITTLISDLSQKEGREVILKEIQRSVPDLIINNAGFGVYGEAIVSPIDEQIEILEVNAKAVLEITLEGAKALKNAGKRGVICNVSSIAGEIPTPLMSVYGASKAFVTQFSKAFDFECRKWGIRILVSAPGQVNTSFARRAAKKEVKNQGFAMSASDAAKEILRQIAREKGFHIFDRKTKFLGWMMKYLLPETLVKKFIMESIQKRL